MFDQTAFSTSVREIADYLRGELLRGRALRMMGSPG